MCGHTKETCTYLITMRGRGSGPTMIPAEERPVHTWNITVPKGCEVHSLYERGTFFVRLTGSGARSVTDEALISALTAKQLIPSEVARYPNVGWYREEDQPFTRILVINEGLDRVSSDLDGVSFKMAVTAPNLPTGTTVRVDVTHCDSLRNTFRVEFVPVTITSAMIASFVSEFCNPLTVNRDKDRLDIFWVTTSTPLVSIPHWMNVTNLVKSEDNPRRLLVTVKDRDIECFYCQETGHWSNRCSIKKERDRDERLRQKQEALRRNNKPYQSRNYKSVGTPAIHQQKDNHNHQHHIARGAGSNGVGKSHITRDYEYSPLCRNLAKKFNTLGQKERPSQEYDSSPESVADGQGKDRHRSLSPQFSEFSPLSNHEDGDEDQDEESDGEINENEDESWKKDLPEALSPKLLIPEIVFFPI